jgi:hypothetical protein
VCFLSLLYNLFLVFVRRFKVEDSCLVGRGEVGSIPEELLLSQGRNHFYRTIFCN